MKFEGRCRKAHYNWLISLLLTLGFTMISACTEKLYAAVDNFNISLITNSIFRGGGDVYVCFLHPLLCQIIRGISSVLPQSDAYVVLMHTLIFISIWMILYVILGKRIELRRKILYCTSLLVSLAVVSVWNINFTVQSVFFVLTGYLLLINIIKENLHSYRRIVQIALGTILVACGFMWRLNGALLTIPFIVLDMISIFLKQLLSSDRKIKIRKQICVVLPAFIVVAALCISQYAVEHSDKYQENFSYNHARTVLEDFPTKSWNEIKNKANRFTEQEYNAAVHWNRKRQIVRLGK